MSRTWRPTPRPFLLVRDVDPTGISGTGVVAEGCAFSDGKVALRWTTPGISEANYERGVRPTTVLHDSVESVIALHGHAGATHIEWIVTALERADDEPIHESGSVRAVGGFLLNEARASVALDGETQSLAPQEYPFACCEHCGCTDDRTGHDDSCSHGCNDDELVVSGRSPERMTAYGKTFLLYADGTVEDEEQT
jgi:hypothetical protein